MELSISWSIHTCFRTRGLVLLLLLLLLRLLRVLTAVGLSSPEKMSPLSQICEAFHRYTIYRVCTHSDNIIPTDELLGTYFYSAILY
jgi:hypothetical protein